MVGNATEDTGRQWDALSHEAVQNAADHADGKVPIADGLEEH